MLSFDIETTGVKIGSDLITVAAVHGYVQGSLVSKCYDFTRKTPGVSFEQERDEFLQVLDDADELCCFNGFRFDIPFVARFFSVDPARVGNWVLKTFDMFHICSNLYNTTFPLNELLKQNGITVKTSSGDEAVRMFYDGRIEELKDYCLNDSIKTYEVHIKNEIRVPKLGVMHTPSFMISSHF